MLIGVLAETLPGEQRVALSPKAVTKLIKLGAQVQIEKGAGLKSHWPDSEYVAAGATIAENSAQLLAQCRTILRLKPPSMQFDQPILSRLNNQHTWISFVQPAQNQELVQAFTKSNATVLAMEGVPRISRAQNMDALSSMANIAGYRSVTEAARSFGRFLGGQITAAGRVQPAKVLVIGAGVAGLAAIGHAKSLGAIVRAFDTRAAVKDEIKSMGAEFLTVSIEEEGSGAGGYGKEMSQAFIDAEMALFALQCREVDIIITTAQIPGKRAPVLITKAMVESMPHGSVIVDLAAETGGNCELTRKGEFYDHHGVRILGMFDLAGRLPTQASEFYATNLVNLLTHLSSGNLGEKPSLSLDHNDVIARNMLITEAGKLLYPPPPLPPPSPAPTKPAVAASAKQEAAKAAGKETPPETKSRTQDYVLGALAILLLLVSPQMPIEFLRQLMVFMLACFVGWQVIWNVHAALHTPLMSVTNAISGIIVLGGLTQLVGSSDMLTTVLAGGATFFALVNVFGGFAVTERMLRMFRR